MNREEYLKQLEAQSGSCSCEQMQGLYSLMRNSESLAKRCDAFKADVDLDNPQEGDLEILLQYKKIAEKFHESFREYQDRLKIMIDIGEVSLQTHYPPESTEYPTTRKINQKDFEKYFEEGNIISLHCPNCEQQIDIVS